MCTVGLLEGFVQLYGKYMLHKCSTLLIGMVGCFVHAHHDHQTEWNEDTTYELGEGRGREERGGEGWGGVEGGWRSGIGQGICAAHPKQSTEESEWSDNGQLLILVPIQVIRTPLKHRWEGRGGEGRGEEGSPLADMVVATNCQACTVSPACGVVWRG